MSPGGALALEVRGRPSATRSSLDRWHAQQHTMREIVDRHFAGADAYWVVPFYMGFLDELPHVWEPYKAARAALANTTNPTEIRRLYQAHTQQLGAVRKQLAHYLTEGVLTEAFALENTSELLHCARACNVTIRWLMLHRRARLRKLPTPDADYERREAEALLLVLMDTAQFEYQLRGLFSSLLDAKETMWAEDKQQVIERLRELSEAFTGLKALTRVGKDEQLQGWFAQLASQVELLDSADLNASGRKMHHVRAWRGAEPPASPTGVARARRLIPLRGAPPHPSERRAASSL